MKKWAAIGLLTAAYFISARYGLSLAFIHSSATAVWPATGLSIAALLLWGYGLWPAVFLGAFLINYQVDQSLPVTAAIAVGNTLEALAGAYAANRFAGGRKAFEKLHSVLIYLLFSAAGATLISATIGTASLCIGGLAAWTSFAGIWLTWWMGDMVSAVLVAPFLIIWAKQGLPRWKAGRWAEFAFLLLSTAFVSKVVLGGWFPGAVKTYPLAHAIVPFLVWASFRFQQIGAISAVFTLSLIAIHGTLAGFGPFGQPGRPHESLLLLQAYTGVMSSVALILAALVSESERTKLALKSVASELKKGNEELEQFTAVASHDLRSPLQKIMMFAENLERKLRGLGAEEKDYLESIKSTVLRMNGLISDLLELSRVSQAPRRQERIALKEFISEILTDLESPIRQKNARIVVGNLPEITADPLRLRHVFQNLIENALKFSGNGKPPLVEIEGEIAGRCAEIRVRDNGVGFDQKYAHKIFQPFQRLDPEMGGAGLGLFTCRKMLEQNGGEIAASGIPEKGAVFTVKIPLDARNN